MTGISDRHRNRQPPPRLNVTLTASTIDEADLLELYRMYRHVYTGMHAAQSTPPLVSNANNNTNSKGGNDHTSHHNANHHAEEDDIALEAAGRTASELVTMALGLGRRMSQRMDRRYGVSIFIWSLLSSENKKLEKFGSSLSVRVCLYNS